MKTCSVLFLTAAAVVAGSVHSFAGDISGVVTLKGTPPAEALLPATLQQDAVCGKAYTTPRTTHHFVVGPDQELASGVVMLKGISGKSTGAKSEPVVLDQKNCMSGPQILAMKSGQKLMVKNSDAV